MMVKQSFQEQPAQWVFNALLGILIGVIGYNVVMMDKRIDDKASKETVAMMCQRLDQKADTSDLNRVDSGLQRQVERMTMEIQGLRGDLNKYFMSGVNETLRTF